jgi:hypothetical protein
LRYAIALSALAAFNEFARAYLQRKHASFPRKLCIPHFAHAQSPGFHFPSPPALDFGAIEPPPLVGVFGFLTFFFFFFVTPGVASSVAFSAGAFAVTGRFPFGVLGLRFPSAFGGFEADSVVGGAFASATSSTFASAFFAVAAGVFFAVLGVFFAAGGSFVGVVSAPPRVRGIARDDRRDRRRAGGCDVELLFGTETPPFRKRAALVSFFD